MSFYDETEYQFLRDYKLGAKTLEPHFAEFKRWFQSHYGVELLAVALDSITYRSGRVSPRLLLITNSTVDFKTLDKALNYRLHRREDQAPLEEFKRVTCRLPLDPSYDLDRMFYSLVDFEDQARDRALSEFLTHDKDRLLDEFAELPIWEIDGVGFAVTVFYNRDSEIERYRESGDNKRLWRRCFELTKAYDEFDYITLDGYRVNFDSKENVDKNYEGSLFYYFR